MVNYLFNNKIFNMARKILICDKIARIANDADVLIYWDLFSELEDAYSIPQVVEDNFDEFRDKYLEWLFDLGNTSIKGRRLIEHFKIRDDFSVWCMSLLKEKNQRKSSSIYDVFRMMAFDKIMLDLEVNYNDEVILSISDKHIQKSARRWFVIKGIPYTLRLNFFKDSERKNRLTFRDLPYTLQGICRLIYNFYTRLFIVESPRENIKGNQISFFSYFFNYDKEKANEGKFRSQYWGELYDYLARENINHNWFHLFVKSNNTRKITRASKLVRNLESSKCESHQLLDGKIGIYTALRIIYDYMGTIAAALRVREVRRDFVLKGSAIDLWPILSHDWNESFFGNTAITNVMYFNLFEKKMKSMPYQSKGFFLLENQAWEKALIYAWNNSKHGVLVGILHTGVSSSDLRFSFAKGEYEDNSILSALAPNYVAVNGNASKSLYLTSNFPRSKIISLEALRYLYIAPYSTEVDKSRTRENCTKLLILGDYECDVTKRQLDLIFAVTDALPDDLEIFIKWHPNCTIDSSELRYGKYTIVKQPLNAIMSEYDLVFTSNATNSALDAYLSGKYVISMLDPNSFNMSPLRGHGKVQFVSTKGELVDAILNYHNHGLNLKEESVKNFFYTDKELPKWRMVISHNQ